MAFDMLLEQAGDLGRFQILQIALFFVTSMITYPHVLLENFTAAIPGHRCWVPLLDNHTASGNDSDILSQDALLRVSIPLDSNLRPEKCRRFTHPQWQLLHLNGTFPNVSESDTEPCVDGWVYDQSSFYSTIVTKWDLVCESQSQKSVVQTLFMSGSLLGSLIFGYLSDRYGRKGVYIWCLLQMAIMDTCATFAPTFLIFCILRFLAGFSIIVVLSNSTILVSEWTVAKSQYIGLTLMLCAYGIGQILLGGLAFAIRDWHTLHLTVSIPLFVLSLFSRRLVESARWLITTNQLVEGTKALRTVAHINGKESAGEILTLEFVRSTMQEEMDKASTKPSIVEVFQAPKLRMIIFYLSFLRLGGTVPFYGLILNLQELGSSIFMFQILFGAVTLISRCIILLIMKYMDRRISQSLFFFLAGLCILVNTFLFKEMQTLRVILATLGVSAVSAALATFSVQSVELIPTICRSTFAGINNVFSRIGSVLAPLLMTLVVYSPHLPWIMYGVFPILCGLIVFCLPETRNRPLPNTIQDVEKDTKDSRRVKNEDTFLKITQF
ncbi:steroid transmembrane transporter SLC22A24-like [Lepus europaeus]|uniref:steroid transmembrane transporter SLC22A24-like n=1 Tax=Lepus europaeus TaxID=9983 RepID=UPI002B46856E|nr:steroid transmembrane transporter SLC22A24-like [Lepus europaeus]